MEKYSPEVVEDQVRVLLTAWGMPATSAKRTAEIMTDADLAGIDSHGISMIPGYNRAVASGEIDLTATSHTVKETPSTAVLDGRLSLGHLTTLAAMDKAIEKAQACGIAAVAVRRSRHFGAAGYYAARAAEAGMIGFVMSTTRTQAVTPTRGRTPVLGTNPLAFAAPSGSGSFVLDMSTSTVAVNKLKVYEYESKPIPSGWVVDSTGEPIVESESAYRAIKDAHSGGLTPLGGTEEMSGHKGYGLAVMVQILAGAFTGTNFQNTTVADGVGHFCMAIDPGHFGDNQAFESSVHDILSTLRDEPPLDPQSPVLVAGDKERLIRAERRVGGVPLSAVLVQQIEDICAASETPFILRPSPHGC